VLAGLTVKFFLTIPFKIIIMIYIVMGAKLPYPKNRKSLFPNLKMGIPVKILQIN
jgi:hypothetical protein